MKFEKFMTDSDKATLAKISDITDELGPDFRAVMDAVFGTSRELVTPAEIAVFTDALNVARAYALANKSSKDAMWAEARNVRRRIRREIKHRARIVAIVRKTENQNAPGRVSAQAGQSVQG